MKSYTKHFHVVYSIQYHFELEGAVLFLYAPINCTSYVKVDRNKNVGLCWFVGRRAGSVCGLVLVNEADLSRVIFRAKGKMVISKNTTR